MNLKKSINISPSIVTSGLAIIASQIMTVSLFIYGPIRENKAYFIIWVFCLFFAGLFFGYFSDKHYRKKFLILSQSIGVVAGLALMFFGMGKVVMVIIALFNPLPVARGALLDNFPKHSSLRVIGMTYGLQYFTWSLFRWLKLPNYNYLVYLALGILFFNIFLTAFFLHDNHVNKSSSRKSDYSFIGLIKLIIGMKALFCSVLALILAESGFYMLMDFFEYLPESSSYFTAASTATILGVAISTIWKELPHKSVISVCYFFGSAFNATGFYLICLLPNIFPASALMIIMSLFSVVGGFYLPMVVDFFITILGPGHKAVGASLAEFSDAFGALLGSLLNFTHASVKILVVYMIVIYLLAAIIQFSVRHQTSSSS